MSNQKFKRGNLVKILIGHLIHGYENGKTTTTDIDTNQIGQLAIIEYSYAEEYGGDNTDSYSVIFQETGNSLAWKEESQLEFVDEGGEHLFKEAKAKYKAIKEQQTDMKYILANWDKGMNSASILYMFGILGFVSSFTTNGEYYCLFSEWGIWEPTLKHIINSKTEKEAFKIFPKPIQEKYNLKEFYLSTRTN